MRWYEIRFPTALLPSLYQAGTVVGDGLWRWMGSAAFDKQGNIGLGYSASSTAVYPQIRYTGRLATDPPGTMRTDVLGFPGGGSQTHATKPVPRWGDYSSLSIDPVDGCTMWYTNQYLPENGSANWRTRIVRFRFAGCSAAADPAHTG